MGKEMRSVVYDADLKLEAYHFAGIMQKFPNQVEGEALDYRCINVQPKTMRKAALEITGKEELFYSCCSS